MLPTVAAVNLRFTKIKDTNCKSLDEAKYALIESFSGKFVQQFCLRALALRLSWAASAQLDSVHPKLFLQTS